MSGAVHVELRGGIGILTLDRPKALNALSRNMVRTVSAALRRWHEDPDVRAVLIKAVPGRSFCAGGDIVDVIGQAKAEGAAAAAPFFFDEYRMNWRIAELGKPYIAFLDGITMGGGVGISVHGSHRIVTENTVLAMPETGIGFFPDVGGTHFLPRLPARTGLYLGLTGERVDGATATRLGIATHFVPASSLPALEKALVEDADIDAALKRLADEPAPGGLDAVAIERLFDARSLGHLWSGLARDGSAFASRTLETLRRKAPLSLAVTFAALGRGARLDLAGCLAMEYRMVHRFLDGHDFREGVRALLVDKDRRPRWRHAAIGDVSGVEVEACFAPLDGGDLILDWQDRGESG